MKKTIPAPAAHILNAIGNIEAPKGYETIYGNNQDKLATPITKMTLNQILTEQPSWTVRFGSSATGRYQFMRNTLKGLIQELRLTGKEKLDPDMQDELAFHLLKRRGYDKWISGALSRSDFMVNLAKEWASFPVPYAMQGQKRKITRGQSYYQGDGKNKPLITPERVEAMLDAAFAMRAVPDVPPIVIGSPVSDPVPSPVTAPATPVKLSWWERFLRAFRGEA